ncbi:MAG: hypothetical protein K0M40_18000 [Prolixibacteraceae bacterium]|nr:hypothetical protein [Prolixibacteraceae bacterium]
MGKMIIPSILTVSDAISMGEKILNISQPLTENDSKFSNLHFKTSKIFDRLVKNKKSTLKSSFTGELLFADKDRGSGFICFRDITHGMSVSLIDDIRVKAIKIYAIIEKHGVGIYSLGYKAESASLLALFAELDKPENQQLLAELGLMMYYTSLKDAETEFNSISAQKSAEKTSISDESEAATIVLQELLPALTSLVSMLQLYSELEPDPWENVYKKVVTYITETNTVARARKTRKQTQSTIEEKEVLN